MARDQRWRVIDHRGFEACALVSLAPMHGARSASLTLIVPADVIAPVRQRIRWEPTSMRGGCALLAQGLRCVLGSPALPIAPLTTLPWQFAAARAFIDHQATRVLLADEVGLGKTVQAALAVHVLRAAGRAARVLILTPAGLRDQWREELARLFGWAPTVADARELRLRRAAVGGHVNPWLAPGITIASQDFVKQPEVLTACTATPWDMLIVDEAHNLAPGTDRLSAAEGIGRTARRVLLLTATPHSGDDDAFEAMCEVGSLEGDPSPLVMIRRTAEAIGRGRERRVRLLRVRKDPAERRVHMLLDRYVRRVWNTPAADPNPARLLAMTILLKRAASSIAALARSLAHRLRCLEDGSPMPLQAILPFDDPGEVDRLDIDFPGSLGTPGLTDRAAELHFLNELLTSAADALACDSKLHLIGRFVCRVREPLLVFTEYRDTLHAIAGRLAGRTAVGTLHGGMNRRERAEAVQAFTSGRLHVLVATDVAAEGLNLHERCRALVNVELPWTPTRLEQRIGRVDRLGQSRRVHAVHLLRRGGVEPWLASRLAARAERARRSLGEDVDPSVADVATTAAALELGHAGNAPSSGLVRPRARSRNINREHWAEGLAETDAARVRDGDALLHAVLSRAAAPAREGHPPRFVTVSRRMARRLQLPPGITLVVRTTCDATGGWTPAPVFIALAFAIDWERAPRRCGSIIERLMPLVQAEAARRSCTLEQEERTRRVTKASLARERALMMATPLDHGAHAAGALQPGLFDRRAERRRAATAEAERQRLLRHASYISAFEADLAAPREVSVDPIVAFVVR